MKKLILCLVVLLPLLVGGCFKDGKDGATGSSGPAGPPGQDALISYNSYEFTSVSNPDVVSIPEITLTGFEAGWQTVTVWVYDNVNVEWTQLFSVGDGTTFDLGFYFYVGDGYIAVEVLENGVMNEPPLVGYDDYMVIVQTFNY